MERSMDKQTYRISIETDPESGRLSATCSMMGFLVHAETDDELIDKIKESARRWFEDETKKKGIERGVPVPHLTQLHQLKEMKVSASRSAILLLTWRSN
jgi:predicted RNase H-like HicB family nuclease